MNEKEKKVAEVAEQPKKAKKAGKLGKKEFLQKFHGKNFKYGSMSTIITVVVVIVAILINIGAIALVARFPSLQLDMSVGNRMSLSKDLTEIIDEVDNKTEIFFCSPRDSFESSFNSTVAQYVGADGMTEGTRLISLVEKAAERNPNITVDFIDMDENPSFAKEFPNEKLSEGCIIIRTDYRYRLLEVSDMYKQQYNQNTGAYTYYSNVEYVLANTLISTNMDDVPVIAFSTGHGETQASYLSNELTDANFEVTSIDLLTATKIDDSIDVIVLAAPTRDFTTEQITLLEDFLHNGGEMGKNVIFMMTPVREKMPNLYAFFADWGLAVGGEGEVVIESESKHYMQSPYMPVLSVNGEEGGAFADFADATVVAYNTVPVKTLFDYDSGVRTNILLSTSNTSYILPSGEKVADYKPQDSDLGTNAVLAYGHKYISKNNEMIFSRVAICGSFSLFDELVMALSGNKNITETFFKYVTDTLGDENSVYIPALEFTASDLALTQSQVDTIGLLVFTILIPLAILAVGLIIWLRRRHL